MKGRWWPWLLLILALVPALLITQPKKTIPSTPSHTDSLAIFHNPGTLDPALATSASEWAVDSNVFSPLFVEGPRGLGPSTLVERYSISGNTLTLSLRPEQLASGALVTASVVAGALNRPLLPSVHSKVAASLLTDVKGTAAVIAGRSSYLSGLSVVNASTLTIQLTRPVTAAFLKNLANPALAIVPMSDMERGGSNWQFTDLVGTGGYRLSNWIPNGYLSFSRVSGGGPQVMSLTVYPSFRMAVQSFRNQAVNFVPVKPAQLRLIPVKEQSDVRALGSSGALSLYYKRGSHHISAYPHITVLKWVTQSLTGTVSHGAGVWPRSIPQGKSMTIYANQDQPEAVQLVTTLSKLEPHRVTYVLVSASALRHLAQTGAIRAYIGEVNWFHSTLKVPLAPVKSFWLVSPNIHHVSVLENGSLDWHSIRTS